MAKRRGRWALAVLTVIVIAVSVLYYLWGKKKKVSLSLAQQIPDTEWLARVNVLSFLNQTMPEIPTDTSIRKFDLKQWDHLLSNPFKTGIDVFSDPWLYGNDSNINLLLHLSDINAFKTWLKLDVEQLKNLDSGSTASYEWMHVTHDNIVFAWNEDGKLLATLSRSANVLDEAHRYFGNEKARGDTSLLGNGKGIVRFRVFGDQFPQRMAWLKNWLPNGTYDVFLEKNRIYINDRIAESDGVSLMDISLKEPGITHKQFWELEEIDAFLGQKLGIKDAGGDPVAPLLLSYAGVDTLMNYHVGFRYDDNFDKVEVKDSSPYYMPRWDLVLGYNNALPFSSLNKQSRMGEGMLSFEAFKYDSMLHLRSGGRIELSKINGDIEIAEMPKIKDFSYIHLKWSEMQKQKESMPIVLPVSGYSFIEELTYQSDGERVFFEVILAK